MDFEDLKDIAVVSDEDGILDASNLTIPILTSQGGNVGLPNVGDMQYDTESDKILVYDGSGDANSVTWKEISAPTPKWREAHYVLYEGEEAIGIYTDIIDAVAEKNFTLYRPDHDGNFFPLTSRELTPAEYDEHLAFETFPVMKKRAESAGGFLLQFPG